MIAIVRLIIRAGLVNMNVPEFSLDNCFFVERFSYDPNNQNSLPKLKLASNSTYCDLIQLM